MQMYGILVGTPVQKVANRSARRVGLPFAPKFRNGLKHKASHRHSGVRKLELRRRKGQERLGEQQVDVDAPAGVARALRVADPSQAALHLEDHFKQSHGFARPLDFKDLVQKVRPLKAPGCGAPQAALTTHRDPLGQLRAGLSQNLRGVFAVAPE